MVVRELTSCSTSTMVASLSKQFDSKHSHQTRDGHETLKLETETFISRDRDDALNSINMPSTAEMRPRRSNFDTRPRRDICRS